MGDLAYNPTQAVLSSEAEVTRAHSLLSPSYFYATVWYFFFPGRGVPFHLIGP